MAVAWKADEATGSASACEWLRVRVCALCVRETETGGETAPRAVAGPTLHVSSMNGRQTWADGRGCALPQSPLPPGCCSGCTQHRAGVLVGTALHHSLQSKTTPLAVCSAMGDRGAVLPCAI